MNKSTAGITPVFGSGRSPFPYAKLRGTSRADVAGTPSPRRDSHLPERVSA